MPTTSSAPSKDSSGPAASADGVTRRRALFVVGAALAEEVCAVPDLPRRGGHMWVQPVASTVGGSAMNVLRNLVGLGRSPIPALTVGTGPAAARVAELLSALGLRSVLPAHARDNGTCLTLITPDGERTFLTAPGCETDWSRTRVATLDVPAGAVVYASGFQLLAPGGHLADWASGLRSDALLVLDPGARCAELVRLPAWRALRDRCDLLTLNGREAAALMDAELHSWHREGSAAGPDSPLAEWALQHRCDVVLRRGAAGATWLPANGGPPVHAAAVPVQVVDTDGAGDAHTAGVMAALADGLEPAVALELAARTAARAVAHAGP
ncbi:hypothetical protein GZ998_07535 [Actinomyces sp. 594]|uniref:PfkB family carbohydrate kinase n=1 Tax=Actinomyces sp. 594 TaxID=2057793 RepID=UPI001C55F8CB|nr:PfkB family carbohydrate kinase [Actinomyces sp. 594]MBW3069351.1 hypothetical protein [Actinomyces sp. 594]